jgi:hypothetical protein
MKVGICLRLDCLHRNQIGDGRNRNGMDNSVGTITRLEREGM